MNDFLKNLDFIAKWMIYLGFSNILSFYHFISLLFVCLNLQSFICKMNDSCKKWSFYCKMIVLILCAASGIWY